ncbi:hypothetical protein [Nocardia miyunensis]|uniref:hypothetical protein n=1 Tax=Nocardia miyunensis TaxID=282684 RepID=UPI000B27B699|nr:hypothetical protein [Nocardia miyunensis]
MDWKTLGAQLDEVSRRYAQQHDFQRTPEWLVLKIAEEAGELVQQFLAATGQGRSRGKSPAELNDAVDNEIADLLGHTILLAHHRGTDLQAALDRKWLWRIANESPPRSVEQRTVEGATAVTNLPDMLQAPKTDNSGASHIAPSDDE